MIYRSLLTLACVAVVAGLAGRAEAQTTAPQCPPGQPCVVVVPQQQPEATPPPPPQQAPGGYVVVQPAQPQSYVVQTQPQQQVYAQPVQQRQPVEVTHTRIRWGLVGPGIGLFAGGWVANWLTGAVGTLAVAFSGSDSTGDYFGWSWVPVVGPWVNAAIAGNQGFDELMGVHILWGVLQTGGLLMCILGTVLQEETTEIRYVQGDGPQIAVLPWADANGAGASVSVVGF